MLPEHGPCLVGGTVTLDKPSLTTKIAHTAQGTPLRPTDDRRSSKKAPPKPLTDVTCWTRCYRWAPFHRLANGPAALALVVVLTNRPFHGPRPASARASNSLAKKNRRALSRYGHAWFLHRSFSTLSCWAATAGCASTPIRTTPRPLILSIVGFGASWHCPTTLLQA